MTNRQGLKRKAHFLGTKIKSLRKRNNLTLEDLSVRCIQIDAEAGPSVSYLSMIENGKRVPSERLLQIVAEIFQKDVNWFYDESLDSPAIDPAPLESAVSGIPLERSAAFRSSPVSCSRRTSCSLRSRNCLHKPARPAASSRTC
jgi:transcriptional regulator with XRE-family HTH domain